MRNGVAIGVVACLLLGGITVPVVFAKRAAPKPVAPVIIDAVRYAPASEHIQDAQGKITGMIASIKAQDAKAGTALWQVVVFEVRFKPDLETDIQEAHISALAAEGGKLVISTEAGQQYLLDPATKSVRGLIRK